MLAGLGDMAVSNTIGSNVFDILVGLGVPWALQTMAVNYGSVVRMSGNSKHLIWGPNIQHMALNWNTMLMPCQGCRGTVGQGGIQYHRPGDLD